MMDSRILVDFLTEGRVEADTGKFGQIVLWFVIEYSNCSPTQPCILQCFDFSAHTLKFPD